MDIEPLDAALSLAQNMLLAVPRQERTPERISEIAGRASDIISLGVGPVSAREVARQLESRFEVWVPQAIVVEDSTGHEPWLDDRLKEIDFAYWDRYSTWLGMRPGWGPQSVEALGDTTNLILSRLEDPRRQGEWDARGLVYGQVQSGKTASYTGLICKAVDAGYRVVVVLTSAHESLRHQTQERLDREFLGFNSKFTREPTNERSLVIGVGELGLRPPTPCISVTTRDTDFTAKVFESTPLDMRQVRLLVVAKKNARVLANLHDWMANFATPPHEGKVLNTPLLLIDDEADYASVDTRNPRRGRSRSDPEHDPTAINKAIRGLLELFEKRVYLGYTATPFANIFIPHDTEHPEHGADLFPRNFMVALGTPSNYCGPEVVFGLEDPFAAEIRSPLPVVRVVDDHAVWIPDRHDKSHVPAAALPPTLVKALDAFSLATSVRRARGDNGHNTMLVHVTRFTSVQGLVAGQVQTHLRAAADAWGDHGEEGRALRGRLRELWQDDLLPTRAELADRGDLAGSVGRAVAWEEVEEHLPQVLDEAARGVRRINGTADDVLDYQSSTPVTVVAVGGDKLSRGLTLEGLTVSYYLRASWAYDTLLQMGRWFGYRPGYLDVTRLYTTTDLIEFYVHITRANRELVDLVTAVSQTPEKTPKDVGLRILDGFGRLQVTASAKMRSSTKMTFTFAGERAETLTMRTDGPAAATNAAAVDYLAGELLGRPAVPQSLRHGDARGLLRHEVPPTVILEFLRRYQVSPRVLQANPDTLRKYIEAQVGKGELANWTVAITGGSAKRTLKIGEIDIPLVVRKRVTGAQRVRSTEYEVGVLVSPAHEAIGMSQVAYDRAFDATRAEILESGSSKVARRPSGKLLRKHRDPSSGLLLIYPLDVDVEGGQTNTQEAVPLPVVGYAFVFPASDNAERLEYRVNQVFIDKLLEPADEVEDVNE